MLEKEAKERQGTRTDISQQIDQSEKSRATERAAKILGTNRQYVSDAKKLKEEQPEKSRYGRNAGWAS